MAAVERPREGKLDGDVFKRLKTSDAIRARMTASRPERCDYASIGTSEKSPAKIF